LCIDVNTKWLREAHAYQFLGTRHPLLALLLALLLVLLLILLPAVDPKRRSHTARQLFFHRVVLLL
jgi:hypothetical protein